MFYKISVLALSLFLGIDGYAHENSFKGINQIKKSGVFLANDLLNNPVILEWEEINGQIDRLSEKIKSLSKILVPYYTQIEVDFARKNPENVSNDWMLKSLASLLEQDTNKVDWNLFQQKTEALLEQFFATMNWKNSAQDINICVTIKDQKTENTLGVILFLITPEFAKNNIKATFYVVVPAAQNRGLEKLLISSIFRLRPDIARVFLSTRSTNQKDILSYKDWGFSQLDIVPNWTDLEYLVEQSNTLQKISDCFIIRS